MQPDILKSVTLFLSRPRTAADLAEHLKISRPTAYAYLRAVRAKKVSTLRQGTKGPPAVTYQAR